MAVHSTPPRFAPLPCCHCRRAVSWPRWRKLATASYAPLCPSCYVASVLIVALARQVAPLSEVRR